MTQLEFSVASVRAEAYAVVPTLVFRLRIRDRAGDKVEAIALRCQIQIEPSARRYRAEEKDRLLELFDEPRRWGETVRPFLWTHATAMVSRFDGETEIDLPIPCTYDFEVAAAKYLSALEDGEVPLRFLFSGMVFGSTDSGLSIGRVAWNNEAAFAMPAAAWREAMERVFPGAAWLRVSRESFERLRSYKARRALLTWDEALDELLAVRVERASA